MSESNKKNPWDDRERETYPMTHAEHYGDKDHGGWEITFDGWTTVISDDRNPTGVEPHIGDLYTFWGQMFRPYRGQAVNGTVLWYRTHEEESEHRRAENERRQQERRAEWEDQKDEYIARIAALPEVFRERIAVRQRNNSDFDWKYGGYELFCCEQAIIMAEAFRKLWPDKEGDELTALINAFYDEPWDVQCGIVLGLADGHSGNTFGASVALANQYLQAPQDIPRIIGALSPLVGSCEYGDVPPDHEACLDE